MPIRYGLGQVVEVRFGPGHDDGRLTGKPEVRFTGIIVVRSRRAANDGKEEFLAAASYA